ncbi:MAG TPA: 30S ribosomal protein S8 [Anaerohalosphaeraceae bacterium]|jgi:small subunit ribosomal protein S8|nr:30S ribosomal protein S8 [Anaerohalosphaeraceae bacterium]
MSLSDPIADMLTRIRNAGRVGRQEVKVPSSKVCQGVASVLKEEGFISDFDRIDDGKQGLLRIRLKYSPSGDHLISEVKRVSKPGRRIYCSVDELPKVLGGLGISIVSTSKGILSNRGCRKENVGGEIICTVS